MRKLGDVSRVLLAVFVTIATSEGRTAAQVIEAVPSPPARGTTGKPLGLTAALGFRSDLVRSPGLDAFSATDGLPQSALAVWYRVGADERAGMAVGFEWDHGTTVDRARASETELVLDRLTLTFEGRVPIGARWAAFGRIAPGLLRDRARIVEVSAPGDRYGGFASGALEQIKWVAAADASAGLAFRLAEIGGRDGPRFVLWLTGEGGYGYAAGHELVLAAGGAGEPGRVDEPLRLGHVALRGGFMRARLAVSF